LGPFTPVPGASPVVGPKELDLEQCIAAARREALELERPCLPQECLGGWEDHSSQIIIIVITNDHS